MDQEVKKYLNAIKGGDSNQVQLGQQRLLKQIGSLNRRQPFDGNYTLIDSVGKRVDLYEFMKSLNPEQLDAIREIIANNLPGDMRGGAADIASSYSVLEIVLGILFFPWSLLYFIFVHPPKF